MVRARLHVICGNCGVLATNDDVSGLSFEIDLEGHDYGTHQSPAVFIICSNCSTIHDLSDTVEEEL